MICVVKSYLIASSEWDWSFFNLPNTSFEPLSHWCEHYQSLVFIIPVYGSECLLGESAEDPDQASAVRSSKYDVPQVYGWSSTMQGPALLFPVLQESSEVSLKPLAASIPKCACLPLPLCPLLQSPRSSAMNCSSTPWIIDFWAYQPIWRARRKNAALSFIDSSALTDCFKPALKPYLEAVLYVLHIFNARGTTWADFGGSKLEFGKGQEELNCRTKVMHPVIREVGGAGKRQPEPTV